MKNTPAIFFEQATNPLKTICLTDAADSPGHSVSPLGTLQDLRVAAHLVPSREAPIPSIACDATPAQAVRVDVHLEDLDDLPQLLVGVLAPQAMDPVQDPAGQVVLAAASYDDAVLREGSVREFLVGVPPNDTS